MIAITTSSSMSVNALRFTRVAEMREGDLDIELIQEEEDWCAFATVSSATEAHAFAVASRERVMRARV